MSFIVVCEEMHPTPGGGVVDVVILFQWAVVTGAECAASRVQNDLTGCNLVVPLPHVASVSEVQLRPQPPRAVGKQAIEA